MGCWPLAGCEGSVVQLVVLEEPTWIVSQISKTWQLADLLGTTFQWFDDGAEHGVSHVRSDLTLDADLLQNLLADIFVQSSDKIHQISTPTNHEAEGVVEEVVDHPCRAPGQGSPNPGVHEFTIHCVEIGQYAAPLDQVWGWIFHPSSAQLSQHCVFRED